MGWLTYGMAASELGVGTHLLVLSPQWALGILVLQMRNLIRTQEKFEEVR